jgi:hypothetical protein
LTALETALDGVALRFKADVVGSIELNREEPRQLSGELARWRRELSVLLGVPSRRSAGMMVV